MNLEDKAPEIRKSLKQCMDIMKRVTPDKITQQEINEVRQQLNFSLTNLETEPKTFKSGEVHISGPGTYYPESEKVNDLRKANNKRLSEGKS